MDLALVVLLMVFVLLACLGMEDLGGTLGVGLMLSVVDVGVGGMLFCVVLLMEFTAVLGVKVVVTGNEGRGMADGRGKWFSGGLVLIGEVLSEAV